MAAPPVKGGPRIIEEIVLKIALPTITMVPRAPSSRVSSGPSMPAFPAVTGTAQGGREAAPPVDGTQPPSPDGTVPAGDGQQQVSVLKLEDMDLDAPPQPGEGRDASQQAVPQVIMMGEEQTGELGSQKIAEQGKASLQVPAGVSSIYTIDPNVIKRLQWRLARMEDFETSIGLAVQEIKEAIAKMETTRLELDEMRKGYAAVEKTMHELAALYDLISASVNPFIDSEDEQKTISTKVMKRTLGMTETGASTPIPVMPYPMQEPGKKKDAASRVDDYSIDTWTVKWAEFLLERIPKSKIPALLDHYIEIGWLDDEIKARAEETIKGISEIDLGIQVPEGEPGEGEDGKMRLDWWKLPIDDHVKSLQFIEKIRGSRTGSVPLPPEEIKKKK